MSSEASNPQLHWLPTPDWAKQPPSFYPDSLQGRFLPHNQHRKINEQVQSLLPVVFPDDCTGTFFLGRQMFQACETTPDVLRVDTEVCRVKRRFAESGEGALYVDERLVVALLWDLTQQKAQVITDSWDESPLNRWTLRQVATHRLSDVPRCAALSEADQQLLQQEWHEVLACIHRAAEEFVADLTSPGGHGWKSFPEQIHMTGEYLVDKLAGFAEGKEFLCTLHFRSQPWMADPEFLDYVGQDLHLLLSGDGTWSFELTSTFVP